MLHPLKRASGLFAGRISSRGSALGLRSRTREIVEMMNGASVPVLNMLGLLGFSARRSTFAGCLEASGP